MATGDQDKLLVVYFESWDIAFYFGSVLAGAWWTSANNLLAWNYDRDTLAEWSKALASGASPQGRGSEPRRCHMIIINMCELPDSGR